MPRSTALADAVFNAAAVRPAIEAAFSRRIAVGVIGDSNTVIFTDTGYYPRMAMAWGDRCGLWGTGLIPGGPDGGFQVTGTRIGWQDGQSTTDTAPTPWADYKLPAGMLTGYRYLAGDYNGGGELIALLAGTGYVEPTEHLRWHQTYFTFAAGAGAFWPAVRDQFSATWRYVHPQAVQTNTGADGLADLTVELAADAARTGNLQLADWKFDDAAKGVTGPWGVLWQQVERADVTAGVSYNLLNYLGGVSARYVAGVWATVTATQAGELFRQLTMHQGVDDADAILMVSIMEGINDAADTNPSVGTRPAPSNTPAGFADNVEAIVNRIATLWAGAGYAAENLYFVLHSPHPRAAYDEQFERMELGLLSLARRLDRTAVVRGSRLTTAAALAAAGYYNDGGADTAHLVDAGQAFMADLRVHALFDAALGAAGIGDATVDANVVRTNGTDLAAAADGYLPVDVRAVNGEPATLAPGGLGTGTGTGDFAVDHDGGAGVTVDGAAAAADCMRVLDGATPVDNVEIAAFLAADYAAGARGAADRRGTTYTGSDGRWEAPLMLDGGAYAVVFSKGGYLIDVVTVEVP